jgi:hypothetical protein
VPSSLFTPAGAGRVLPTEHARGPWDPDALHGGAPAALIAHVFERLEPGRELTFARLGFEFLKPIPFAELEVRISSLAARESAGGGSPGRYLPVSTPCSGACPSGSGSG